MELCLFVDARLRQGGHGHYRPSGMSVVSLPTVFNDPLSYSILKFLVHRLRRKKGTLFRFFGQLRNVATRSMTSRSPRVEYSIPERLPPFPPVRLSGTDCSPNRTGLTTNCRLDLQLNPIRLIVPSLPGAPRVEVKCLAAAWGWDRSCLGIKVEDHDLSISQVPQRSFIPPRRSHLSYSFLSSLNLHNEDLRNPLRSPGSGPFLQRWCVPILPLSRPGDSLAFDQCH